MTEIHLTNKELDDIYSKASNEFAKTSIRDRAKNHLVTCVIEQFMLHCKLKGYTIESGKIYKLK